MASKRLLNPRAAKPAAASLGFIERVNNAPFNVFNLLDDKLGDSIARGDFKS